MGWIAFFLYTDGFIYGLWIKLTEDLHCGFSRLTVVARIFMQTGVTLNS